MARRAYDPDDPDRMQREAARGDNRAVQQFSAQDTFNQERERIRQIALANGLNPDHYANIGNWYDQSKLYEGAPVEHMRGNFSLNPDGTIPIQQVLHSYKGSGAEFEGIPLQQWLAGPSSPWRVNAAGTGATYDPTKWTYKANYSPKDSFMDNFGLYAIGALGGAGMAGLLPGTTAAFGGAAAPAATTAGSTAGTGAAGWGASFAPTITQGTVAGADLGLTLGAPASMAGGGVAGAMGAAPGFAGSFAPTRGPASLGSTRKHDNRRQWCRRNWERVNGQSDD